MNSRTQAIESSPSLFRQRMVAESIRIEEERAGAVREAPEAEERARESGETLEGRILVRAMTLPDGASRMRAVARIFGSIRIALLLLAVLVFIAGMVAARIALGTDGDVNVVRAIVGLLYVQLLALVIWALLIVLPFSRGGVIGRLVMVTAAWLGRRLSGVGKGASAGVTALGILGRGDMGRGLLSTATHTLWFSYTAGALAAALVLMAIYQYDFHWATTIVPDEAMVAMLAGLGSAPSLFGFQVPDPELIRFSRRGMEPGYGREAWSGLVVGSLVVFGLVPRLLFACLGLVQLRRATAGYRLDLTRPGYARLAHRLQPVSSRLGRKGAPPPIPVTDHIPGSQRFDAAPSVNPAEADGVVYLVGLERDPEVPWPPVDPALESVELLGCADNRVGRKDILAALESLPTPPGRVLVLTPTARTPDRGIESFLRALGERAFAPVWLILETAPALGDDRARHRTEQWRRLAGRAGVEQVQVLGPAGSGTKQRVAGS